MTNYVIIVAGGKGLRMGSDVPKQFLPIGGKPVLMHTLEAFYRYDCALRIILVLPVAQQSYWKELCTQYDCSVPYQLADGGETRFHSVSNGLSLVPNDADGVVGVHDGVRPFVDSKVIQACFEGAVLHKAVVPVVDIVETVRHILSPDAVQKRSETVCRTDYKLVQTPQAFQIRLLKKAYCQAFRDTFTDDASVVEALGQQIVLVNGNRENIKITTPFDIKVATALLEK